MIASRHRLLGESDIGRIANAPDGRHRDFRSWPAAVCVNAELYGIADGATNGADASDISIWIDADLGLHGREAAAGGPTGDFGGLRGLDTGNRPFCGDKVAHFAAEQAIDRLVERLAQHVPQSHFDAGLREGIAGHGERVLRRQAIDVGVLHDACQHEVVGRDLRALVEAGVGVERHPRQRPREPVRGLEPQRIVIPRVER